MPYKDRQERTCGFVEYEEQELSGRFYRRYFMISPQDGAFYCFMDNPNNLLDGATPVTDIKLSHISNARDASKQRPKVEYCFVVMTPDRSYYFGADNQADLEEWVRSLNSASRIIIPDTKLKPASGEQSRQDQSGNSENGGEKQSTTTDKQGTTSYKTEIIAGVVMKTPVVRIGHQSNLPKRPLQCYSPAIGNLNLSLTPPVDSDSDDGGSEGSSRSWPRSPAVAPPSPTPPLNRAAPIFSSKVIKAGFGVKQGGVRKNWKRRYFILDESGLAYFKSDMDKLPLRTIPKKDITCCRVSDIPLSTQRDNLFEVTTVTRTFYIQAYSPEEMKDWVTKIRMLVSSKRASCPEQSILCTKAKADRGPLPTDTTKNTKSHTLPIKTNTSNKELLKLTAERHQRISPSKQQNKNLKPSLTLYTSWFQEDGNTPSTEETSVDKDGVKGQVHSPETNADKGQVHSPETDADKGQVHSPETDADKGQVHSPETDADKGQVHSPETDADKGQVHSPETDADKGQDGNAGDSFL